MLEQLGHGVRAVYGYVYRTIRLGSYGPREKRHSFIQVRGSIEESDVIFSKYGAQGVALGRPSHDRTYRLERRNSLIVDEEMESITLATLRSALLLKTRLQNLLGFKMLYF